MNGATEATVDAFVAFILRWAEERGVGLGESVELFVEPELDTDLCDYYFIDHLGRRVFWLESATTGELGLSNACSERHLG